MEAGIKLGSHKYRRLAADKKKPVAIENIWLKTSVTHVSKTATE